MNTAENSSGCIKFSRIDESWARFANHGAEDGSFVHPVIRAIALHFWLAYDHPFQDGNGRTARALFYWAMLRHGYRMFEFTSISRLLVRAPVQYGRASKNASAPSPPAIERRALSFVPARLPKGRIEAGRSPDSGAASVSSSPAPGVSPGSE